MDYISIDSGQKQLFTEVKGEFRDPNIIVGVLSAILPLRMMEARDPAVIGDRCQGSFPFSHLDSPPCVGG